MGNIGYIFGYGLIFAFSVGALFGYFLRGIILKLDREDNQNGSHKL